MSYGLLVPNIAANILRNDEIEEVRFFRDEQSNLVWAWEYRVVDENGISKTTNFDSLENSSELPEGELPQFLLKSRTPRSWIPYLPRQYTDNPLLSGEMYLRRGRTDENATESNPQYRSQVVKESILLHEEEIPVTGIRVRRQQRYAKGSDGKQHFWVGREKDAAQRTTRPGLKFDYLK